MLCIEIHASFLRKSLCLIELQAELVDFLMRHNFYLQKWLADILRLFRMECVAGISSNMNLANFFSQGKQRTVYIVKMSFQTKIRVLENYMSLSLLALQNFKNCSDDIVGDTIKWNVSTFGRSWKLSKPMFSEWPTHIIKSGMGKISTQSIRQANETV